MITTGQTKRQRESDIILYLNKMSIGVLRDWFSSLSLVDVVACFSFLYLSNSKRERRKKKAIRSMRLLKSKNKTKKSVCQHYLSSHSVQPKLQSTKQHKTPQSFSISFRFWHISSWRNKNEMAKIFVYLWPSISHRQCAICSIGVLVAVRAMCAAMLRMIFWPFDLRWNDLVRITKWEWRRLVGQQGAPHILYGSSN